MITLDLKELLDTSVILFPDELLIYYLKKEELDTRKEDITIDQSNILKYMNDLGLEREEDVFKRNSKL